MTRPTTPAPDAASDDPMARLRARHEAHPPPDDASLARVVAPLADGYGMASIDPRDARAVVVALADARADLARLRAPAADLAAIGARAAERARRRRYQIVCTSPAIVVGRDGAVTIDDNETRTEHEHAPTEADADVTALLALIAARDAAHAAEIAAYGDALGRSRESIAEACDAAVAATHERHAAEVAGARAAGRADGLREAADLVDGDGDSELTSLLAGRLCDRAAAVAALGAKGGA